MNKQQYANRFGRWINSNEIVFDVDNRDLGLEGINFIAINLHKAGYNFEVWFAQGQKSPHIHVKNISGLEELEKHQLIKYKKLFIVKHTPKKYLDFMDVQITGKHRIAEENKAHYKYYTIKELKSVWNKDKENIVEEELIQESKKEKKIEVSIDPNATLLKDKIPITAIAQKFNLERTGINYNCPFHKSTGKQSLSLSDEKGIFYCFGCGAKGDLITFYKMLKELQNAKSKS